jgi:hypothetical protein
MRATISKNYKFIQLSEKPFRTVTSGLRVYHRAETDTTEPVSSTNLIAGKTRYFLNGLPKEARESIYKVEAFLYGRWTPLHTINNNQVTL